MQADKKYYFVSDLHLGMHPKDQSRKREHIFVEFLTSIQNEAEEIYLVGDIFDYWWEYGKVVPKGFVRILGKLAELSDNGINIHFFKGNHDIWTFGYLEKEIGMTVHTKPLLTELNGKKVYIAHGDGLGKGDFRYKILKACFHSRILQRLYALLHPDIAIGIAHMWAKKSGYDKNKEGIFLGEDKELLFQHARQVLQKESIDYFIFGHRHIPLTAPVCSQSKKSTIIYLGDWIRSFTYGVLEKGEITLQSYTPDSN